MQRHVLAGLLDASSSTASCGCSSLRPTKFDQQQQHSPGVCEGIVTTLQSRQHDI
jgi:hypothetical protein